MITECPLCKCSIHVVTSDGGDLYYTGGCQHAQVEQRNGVVNVVYPEPPRALKPLKKTISAATDTAVFEVK